MENPQEVKLTWRGPFSLLNFETELPSAIKEEAKRPGVYLHCLECDRDKRYHVVYIGKSVSIINRQGRHANMLGDERYSLVNVSAFTADCVLDVIWIPDYGMREPETTVLESNMKAFKVFFATVDVEKVSPLVVEGALQVHFWRNMNTRKFLLTQRVSDWNYRGKIYNRTDIDIKLINGLDSIIDSQETSRLS